ncbi:trimeric intracellular cation channel family protein [Streptomyces bauhiniae]|uniref:trimeric intracellular cation channel family protein n=1 Tax=Streptomyces bauhiniae TaxID=2340725 RepID=UPI0036612726
MISSSPIPAGITVTTRYLDLAGVFSCALLGGAMARTAGLDLFGFLAVGVISGLGGGMIRDVLLQHGTPVALTDYAYLPTALAGAAVVFVIKFSESAWTRIFTALDAAVIGCWAVAGVNKTLAVGLGWLPAVLLGTVTVVGGGALRDIVLGRRPAVLGGNGLYATVAIAVAGTTVICVYRGAPALGTALGIVLALVFRLAAVRWGWNLPGGLEWRSGSATAARLRRGIGIAKTDDEERPHPPEEKP